MGVMGVLAMSGLRNSVRAYVPVYWWARVAMS